MQEDFESGFDEQWRLENANSSYNWGLIDIPNGPFCNPTKAAFIDHYSINQTGDEAELITTYIDLTGVNQPSLRFDYAYATYASNYQDGFRIDISTIFSINPTSSTSSMAGSAQHHPAFHHLLKNALLLLIHDFDQEIDLSYLEDPVSLPHQAVKLAQDLQNILHMFVPMYHFEEQQL